MISLAGYYLRESQVLYKGKSCVGLFPQVQILPGHILITNLSERYQYSKWSLQQIEESSSIGYKMNKKLCQYYKTQTTTFYIQLIDSQIIRKSVLHIIPRTNNDFPDNDQIYKAFQTFPKQLLQRNRLFEQKPELLKDYLQPIQKLKEQLVKMMNS